MSFAPRNGSTGTADAAVAGPSSAPYLTSVTTANAYYTPATYKLLLSQTLSLDTNPSAALAFESRRSQACGLIAAVGARVGLPQRTIDTAFVIWQRFGASHGAASGNSGQQMALASLFVACKMNDTPKKARDLILASYAIRHPALVKHQASTSADRRQQLREMALASVQESDVEPQVIESERTKILSLEKMLLEAVGYDFKVKEAVESVGRGVIKLGKAWKVGRETIRLAWHIASDLHRTSACLTYPPVILSASAILTAALLFPDSDCGVIRRLTRLKTTANGHSVADPSINGSTNGHTQEQSNFSQNGDAGSHSGVGAWSREESWEEALRCYREEMEDATHTVLDLYLASCSSLSSSAGGSRSHMLSPSSASPATPISPMSPSEYYGSSGPSKRSSTSSLKLPSSVSNAPPLGVIAWLQAHCPPQVAEEDFQSVTELAKALTDAKIELRAVEDARREEQKRTGTIESQETTRKRRRVERRSEIDEAKGEVQTLKVTVQEGNAGASGAVEDKATAPPPSPALSTTLVVFSDPVTSTPGNWEAETVPPPAGKSYTSAKTSSSTDDSPQVDGLSSAGGNFPSALNMRQSKTMRFLF